MVHCSQVQLCYVLFGIISYQSLTLEIKFKAVGTLYRISVPHVEKLEKVYVKENQIMFHFLQSFEVRFLDHLKSFYDTIFLLCKDIL